ncbi:hypothetical protein [Schlesneria paludicola]|uniref:hypothetical protein n=1 Tax=Schlesneria paludicola TaxID=360056 RepID=UPI0002D4A851|nr:hypothetical protein [Schlesneria paludicola]
MSSPDKIVIELTNQEALVLFEFLRRCEDENDYKFADQSEERILLTLEVILEKQLTEIFSPDYSRILEEARKQIRDAD